MKDILNRKSVRKFNSEVVSDSDINKILEAAMAAPSAMNQQPWQFVVIQNKEKLNELANSSPFFAPLKTASVAIVVATTKGEIKVPACVDYDLAICSENIMIAASSLGLGSVWLAVKPDPERVKNVGIILNDPSLDALNIIPIGYSDSVSEYVSKFDSEKITFIK